MVFIVNEKIPVAISKKKIPKSLSVGVYGDTSPYPTVVMVATAQYNELMYLSAQPESSNEYTLSQLSPTSSF